MTKNQIAALKSSIQERFPEASKLQYHRSTDTVSGYGRNLASPRHASTNIDKHGYARYVLAERGYGKSWNTVHGEPIINTDGDFVQ